MKTVKLDFIPFKTPFKIFMDEKTFNDAIKHGEMFYSIPKSKSVVHYARTYWKVKDKRNGSGERILTEIIDEYH